jgi:hypothetical protein
MAMADGEKSAAHNKRPGEEKVLRFMFALVETKRRSRPDTL